MGMQVIDHTVVSAADPQTVYELLADGATWPRWSAIDEFTLVEPGGGAPEGLGAVRIFRTGRIKSRERVVERGPGESFAYVLESGLPLRDYKAVVSLTPTEQGRTSVNWHATFRPMVPGTGWIYRRELGKFIGQLVRDLARAAERAPRQPASSSSSELSSPTSPSSPV